MFVELLRGHLLLHSPGEGLVRMWFPYLLCEEPILWLFSRIFFLMFSSPSSKGGLTLRSSIIAYFWRSTINYLDLGVQENGSMLASFSNMITMHFHYVTDNYLVCMMFTVLALKMLSQVFPGLNYRNSVIMKQRHFGIIEIILGIFF